MCQHSESGLIARCYLHIATVLYYLFDSRIKTDSIFIIRNCDLVTCRYNYLYPGGYKLLLTGEPPLAGWESRYKVLNCRAGLHISGRYNRCGAGRLKVKTSKAFDCYPTCDVDVFDARGDSQQLYYIGTMALIAARDSCTVLRADTGSVWPYSAKTVPRSIRTPKQPPLTLNCTNIKCNDSDR